uniref:Interleukin-18 receptor accessory protein isoform X1 n=1 Tax=Pogona vitticeps TaxID=103695 RepID=A0ABM5FYY7_9SAUR
MKLSCWIILLLMRGSEVIDCNVTECLHKHTDMRYRAISGQKFVVSCDLPSEDPASIFNYSHLYEDQMQWFWKSSDDGEIKMLLRSATANPVFQGNAIWFDPITVQHSGTYICTNGEKPPRYVNILIAVQTEETANCSGKSPSHRYLLVKQGASITCPGKHCFRNFPHSSVKWYQNGKKIKLQKVKRPSLQLQDDKIILHSVYDRDRGIYICDYLLTDNNTPWKMRTVVNITIISKDTVNPPKILYPSNVTTLEVDVGHLLEMECKAQFGFELNASSSIQWYRETSKSKLLVQQKRVDPKGIEGQTFSDIFNLTNVNEEDLNSHFICLAQNSVGHSTGIFKLRRKREKVLYFLLALCCIIIALFGVVLGGMLAYWRWIDLVLFYRYYLAKDETLGDCKEFDAFVSHATPNSLGAHHALFEEEQFALEYLPQVLENEYGYKLCLMERNILPGGAYTDDIVNAIKSSRRAIMILTPSYFKNRESIFELEAAVNTALEDKTLKLILIQFESFQEPQSLPSKVKTALRILPRINWKTSTSPTANKQFWKKLQYHMPVKHTKEAGSKWLFFSSSSYWPWSKDNQEGTRGRNTEKDLGRNSPKVETYQGRGCS